MNYSKLFKEKAEGNIDDRMILVFDNDCGFWSCDTDDDEESNRMCAEYTERYGEPDGYYDSIDIMIGAGFRAEQC